MIIGIDGNEANVEKRVGISEYCFELLKQFNKYEILNTKFEIFLKDAPKADMPPESESWRYQVIRPRKLWTQVALPFRLFTSRNKPDVFFTPSHYAPRFSPVPTVIAIMDLAYVHFPELFRSQDLYQLKNWTKYSVEKAARILTISNSSANDIIKTYKVQPEKVQVTYLGIKPAVSLEPNIYLMNDLRKRHGIRDSYVLFVGTLQPRKNIEKLIEAFSLIRKDDKYSDIQLVIVGKKGWLYDQILNAPVKFSVEEQVKFLDFVSDEELSELYKHAKCFVLPSLYEGFGLPVLEAMKHGCPVITSNVSSLPEAGGDAALYIDPNNAEDIAEKIKKVIRDNEVAEKMRKKGYEQVKKFSWEKTARETLKALVEVAEKK